MLNGLNDGHILPFIKQSAYLGRVCEFLFTIHPQAVNMR